MSLSSVDPAINNDTSSSVYQESEEVEHEHNLQTKWKRLRELVTVEPLLLFHMIALSSCFVNVQNYYIDCICLQEFKNNTLCSNLVNYPDEGDYHIPDMNFKYDLNQNTNTQQISISEEHVEGIASLYATYRGVIEAGLPILFSLFLGSWSDKHGCKLPMIFTLGGYTLSAMMYTIFAFMPNQDPRVLLTASIPIALTGGLIALLASVFKYISDITSVENRSFRIAVAESSWFLGSPIGLLGSAQVLKYAGYHSVFMITSFFYTSSMVYTIFFVKNIKPSNESDSNSNMFMDMFNVPALKDTIHTFFRKRNGMGRLWIILLLITLCFRILTLTGGFSVTYLYTRSKFGWTNEDYSTFSTVIDILGVFGSGLGILLLMKILKLSDSMIGFIGSISYLGATILFMVSFSGWMMYLGGLVRMFSGLISIVVRAMLSKIVSKDELGKVFSFLASGEAAMPLISAPLFNFVFIETISSFPGAVFLLSAFFNGCIVLTFIYFCIALRNPMTHRELVEHHTETRT